jgi:hypothetical protein
MSLAEQKKQLEHYNKVKAEKESRKKGGVNYKAKPERVATCAYCKEEGHWLKDRKSNTILCPKLKAKNARSAKRNADKRSEVRKWRDEQSAGCEGSGWETAGSSNKVAVAKKNEVAVLKVAKNSFEVLDTEDVRVEVANKPVKKVKQAWKLVPMNVDGSWGGDELC